MAFHFNTHKKKYINIQINNLTSIDPFGFSLFNCQRAIIHCDVMMPLLPHDNYHTNNFTFIKYRKCYT